MGVRCLCTMLVRRLLFITVVLGSHPSTTASRSATTTPSPVTVEMKCFPGLGSLSALRAVRTGPAFPERSNYD